jgi:tRNA-2-methylthio-N6-dimethylallyladenosine synthase
LSTDMIVGFPGETAEDFASTLELVERVGFLGVYAFKYSRRPSTPALKLEDDVSDEEKSARLARLFELSESRLERHLASLVGSTQEVLIEGRDERGKVYSGRSAQNEIVHVDCTEDITGRVLEVRIAAAFKHSLLGAPLGAQSPARPARVPPQQRALPMLR